MSPNTYCNPKIFIEDKEFENISSITYSSSVSSISTLSVKLENPDLENMDFFNRKIEFFLNEGGEDNIPLFRGLIKQSNASESGVAITASDLRTFISGNEAFVTVIDDHKNYDGQTVMQFLIDVIENELNAPSWVSTSATNDMDKPVFMTGVRETNGPYDIVKSLIEKKLDEDDVSNSGEYFLDVFHEEDKSSIIVKKTRTADINNFDFSLSYFNGIIDATFKDRPNPSYATAQSEDGSRVRLDYGNAPQGNYGVTLSGKFSSRGEAKENMLPFLLAKQDSEKDITLNVSSCFYADLGNVIFIDVPDDNLSGQYRITSKNISISNNSIDCSFSLNKKPAKISDYLT